MLLNFHLMNSSAGFGSLPPAEVWGGGSDTLGEALEEVEQILGRAAGGGAAGGRGGEGEQGAAANRPDAGPKCGIGPVASESGSRGADLRFRAHTRGRGCGIGRRRTLICGEADVQVNLLYLLLEKILLIQEEDDRLVRVPPVARDIEEVETLLEAATRRQGGGLRVGVIEVLTGWRSTELAWHGAGMAWCWRGARA